MARTTHRTILAIETSCDETGLALVRAAGTLSGRPTFKIIKSELASQVAVHAPFGGVVPNLAKREHLINLPILFERMFPGGKGMDKVDFITVTVGPGLEPALWTGIVFAKEIGKKYKKPVVGANHLEGHLYSFLLPGGKTPKGAALKGVFPAIALIVSGGHTLLLCLKNLREWKRLGETRDDAAGEAYDKVARLLRFPYPGGPEIEKAALRGNPNAIAFPRPMFHDTNFDFSFSGLKTAVLYYLRDNPGAAPDDVAASFEAAVIDVLTHKTIAAAKKYKAKSVILSGGVASNTHLRNALAIAAKKNNIHFFVPERQYNTDNGVMIAAAGYIAYLKKKKYRLSAKGDLNI